MKIDDININFHQGDFKAALHIEPCRWITISYLQENIISIFIKKRIDLLYPFWSIGASIKPIIGLALTWNIHSTPHGYVNTFSLTSNILKYLSISTGYAKETSSYSGAVSISYKYLSISYGLKFHPELGYTHSAGISISTESLEFESIEYMKFRDRPYKRKRMDINHCKPGDLEKIKIISNDFIKRIEKYKKNFGIITIKSLYQIGMTSSEINELSRYFIIKKDKKRNQKYYSKNSINVYKKKVFNEFLESGLNAYSALKLSNLLIEKNKKKIRNFIMSINNIDKKKKEEIYMICLKKLK